MANEVKTTFAWEPISAAMAGGIEDLIAFNWEAATKDADYPELDIDWPAYLMAERNGFFKGVAARRGSRLIGYNGYFIRPPLRHKSSLWAINDALYIAPEERKGMLGIKLITESHRLLKDLGVQYIAQDDTLADDLAAAKPRASFGDLLTKLGYKPLGRMYLLKL